MPLKINVRSSLRCAPSSLFIGQSTSHPYQSRVQRCSLLRMLNLRNLKHAWRSNKPQRAPKCPAAYHPRHHSQRPAHLLRLRDFSGLFERERERERLLDGLRLLERLLDLLLRLRLRSERRLSRERERERERPPLLLPPGMPSPRSCLTRM